MNALEIYTNHLNEFKQGNITIESKNRKYKTADEFKNSLLNGEISAALFNICAQKTLGTFQLLGFYTLLDFSSIQAERKFKAGFINALNQIDIN